MLQEYTKHRSLFLVSNPTCTICKLNQSTDIHHQLPLGRGGKLNDTTIFLAVCRACHNKIHQDPKWAEDNNYLWKKHPNAS